MKRTSSKDRARTRILTDDELRAIWKQAEEPGPFGALVQAVAVDGAASIQGCLDALGGREP